MIKASSMASRPTVHSYQNQGFKQSKTPAFTGNKSTKQSNGPIYNKTVKTDFKVNNMGEPVLE